MIKEDRFSMGRRVSLQTIVANIFLMVAKLIAGLMANSSAMVADAVHSGSDILTTVGVIFSLKIAKQPADDKHPYGHGRAESITAKLLAVILIAVGVWIFCSSFQKIRTGQFTTPGSIAIWTALVSIVVKEWMYHYTVRVAKKINSSALVADAWHHRSDAFSSVASFLGILGARRGYPILDPLVGGVVALFIVWVGWKILRESIDELMDARIDGEMLDKITACVDTVEGVLALHDLKVRKYGSFYVVDLKIGVDADSSVQEAHKITSSVKQCIKTRVELVSDVMIHVNPQA
jgi:cation diffusion facilitator family transporter